MAPTNMLETGDLTIPAQKLTPWLGKIGAGSTVAVLSGSEPMTFGTGEAFVYDIGEAELVGESGAKSTEKPTKSSQNIAPYKFQKTIRMSEEVLWADEDRQLQAVDDILAGVQPALSRALDFGVYHGINPMSGDVSGSISSKLSDTTNIVTRGSGDKGYANLDAADTLVLADEYAPSSIAVDPTFAAVFATARNATTEQKIHPDFKVSVEASTLEGHTASVSRTVGAASVATVPTGVLAFVGDFGGIRWGVQRSIGLELIRYGDPDGEGDLKRYNQVAFRAEVVYGWGFNDLNAFAVIKSASSS